MSKKLFDKIDGKFVVAGRFSHYNGQLISPSLNSGLNKSIMRFNSDGSVDTSFNLRHYDPTNGYESFSLTETSQIEDVLIDQSGNMFIAGKIQIYGKNCLYNEYSNCKSTPSTSTFQTVILKIDQTGLLLNSKKIGETTGMISTIYDIEFDSDGNLLIGGIFPSIYGGTTDSTKNLNYACFAKLNSSNLDINTNFTVTHDIFKVNATVYSILRKTDGKILLGGDFSSVSLRVTPVLSASAFKLLVLNADLSVVGFEDENNPNLSAQPFNTNQFNGSGARISKIIETSDGNLMVGGNFTNYSSYTEDSTAGLVKIDLLGNKIPTFNGGFGIIPPSNISGIIERPDGKILVSGTFKSFKRQAANSIILLNQYGNEN